MWKYKGQTLVSVAGLAVGFVCFAMATLWIRYEMSYDSFHRNADRIYCVYTFDINVFETGMSQIRIPISGAEYFKSTFPEIENAVVVELLKAEFGYEGTRHRTNIFWIDSSFFSMFDVRIVEGNRDFLIPESKKTAITREKAVQLFGNESPVGKQIEMYNDSCEICAVVTGFPKHSNYQFDFLRGMSTCVRTDTDGNIYANGFFICGGTVFLKVVPGIDMEAFERKFNEHKFPETDFTYKDMTLIPLTEMHYKDPKVERNVQFQHIFIFVLAGSLLILCTLFNYLTLFISRFRIRQRELALRVVYGASGRSLFTMLAVEFLLSLIAALLLGLVLINTVSAPFLTVSGIQLKLPAIYLESTIYVAGVIVVSLMIFVVTLVFFRRRTLNANIRYSNKIFRKTSIVAQLVISIVFAFCTFIILKQMYHLHGSDLGFAIKNRGVIHTGISPDLLKVLGDKVKQIPEIQETLVEEKPLLPIMSRLSMEISDWDGKQGDKHLDIEIFQLSEYSVKFHELQLVEGDFVRDYDDKKYLLINESAAKALGWDKAVGKILPLTSDGCVVKGVVRNIYNFSPTIAAKPFCYARPGTTDWTQSAPFILFKYNEGSWKTCIDKISKIVETEFPDAYVRYYDTEEEYDKYLKSENTLLAILTVVSLVCVIVCIFGFVSMVSLTCEERRKEIAIRKINGATIKDILDIFFKEYLTLLAVGALIAFPVGYIIMKRWLEQYVIQTEMSAWVYLSILLSLIMVIVISVGGRVYKTSRENPVNALNK
jgi:hypothetical protein